MNSSKSISLQYQGYLNTPLLWNNHALFGIEQLHVVSSETSTFKGAIPDNLVLGKRVERFVFEELEQLKSIEILLKNNQIQNGKTTVGEIDCMLKQDGDPVHLEIVFKFYLYDPAIGTNEIDRWIGPNRKDTLVKKLTKLKEKQLPLLFNKHTETVLNNLALDANHIDQRVLFKAQLFTPYKAKVTFNTLNQECLMGFYVNPLELEQFIKCEFYIPKKVDWLIEANNEVEWSDLNSFKQSTLYLMENKKAPLCWIKFPNGKLSKFFVVWWN